MSKVGYTFTCDKCKKTFPMSKVSSMIAWHCKKCAAMLTDINITKTKQDNEERQEEIKGYPCLILNIKKLSED